MPGQARRRRSSKKKTVRWVVAAIILCSTLSCVAPVLYASDCSRWIAEYKQGLLQKRAARRLRAAKYRLTVLVGRQKPVRRYPSRHPMGPLEALRRFQIDCGDLESPVAPPRMPTPPLAARPLLVSFPEMPPPDLPLPTDTEVAENVPPLVDVPTNSTPVENVPQVGPVPEPASLALVASGALAVSVLMRKRRLTDQ